MIPTRRNAFHRPVRIVLLFVFAGPIVACTVGLARSFQDATAAAVTFELPSSVETQERAGLIVQGVFRGRIDKPTWIAQPSGEWIRVLLRDRQGKLVMDRRLWPYAPGRQPVVTPTVVYSRLGFPFEVLRRCETLGPGSYSLEIHYDSPATTQAVPVNHTATLKLTVRSDKAVPLRHLSLEVPERVVYDDFRNPTFGLSIRVVNDGCETQNIISFAPESVVVQVQASDGHSVSCRPAVPAAAAQTITLAPMQSWSAFIAFSGRCDIPLPTGAAERTQYRVHVNYRGPGWTAAPLQLDRTVQLELANLPHSSPVPPSAR